MAAETDRPAAAVMPGQLDAGTVAGTFSRADRSDARHPVQCGHLVYYKYANFFVAEFNRVAGGTSFAVKDWQAVALPIGISFFTFQGMSYMLDVWRKVTGRIATLWTSFCASAFFPI